MQTWQNWSDPPSAPPPRTFNHGNGAVYLRGARGLGALSALTASGLGPWAETAASVLGSGAGGALIGVVAAHNKDGALHGAAFAAGLAGVTEGYSTYKSFNRIGGATLIALGLTGMLWSLSPFIHFRRH